MFPQEHIGKRSNRVLELGKECKKKLEPESLFFGY